MRKAKTNIDFKSPVVRAQYFIDHFHDMTYKEFAFTFGWAKRGDSEIEINRGIQRVKNLKKSLENKINGLNLKKGLSTVKPSEINIPDSLKVLRLKSQTGPSKIPPLNSPRSPLEAPSLNSRLLSPLDAPSLNSPRTPLEVIPLDSPMELSTIGSRQGVPREGYDRHTMIISDRYYKRIKSIQKETGLSIREIMDDILSSFFKE